MEFGLWLFVFCLPVSMIAWTLAVLAVGWLQDPADQPSEFGFFAAATHLFVSERASVRSPDRMAIGAALVFWGLANGPLLIVLVKMLYDLVGMLFLVAYVGVQILWLLRIRRAIVRSRTGTGGD
jgi:hypothetical protein